MRGKLRYLVLILFVSVATGTGEAAVFFDGFEAAHDFVADGVAGTFWDGFLGLGPSETVDALNASTDRPGQLYVASTGAFYHEPWEPLGPFLYKVIEGDFVVTVQVTEYAGTEAAPVYHNNCGVLVRAVPEEAGPGEDWVALDYFPIWSCGNFVRTANDNARTEDGHNGRQFNLDPYLQIQRIGNVFHFRTSADGLTWTDMGPSPITRDDFDGLALQVGLYQATYSGDQGYAAFDNFSIEGPLVVPGLKTYNPSPADEVTDVPRDAGFAWVSPEAAATYDVYFGFTFDDVEAADTANPGDVLVSQGQSAMTYDPDGLFEFGQTYYWRVDLIAPDASIYKGDVWEFTAEPYAYPIEAVTAATNGVSDDGAGPENTVNGSGLNASDQHSVSAYDMWAATPGAGETLYIQYEFDKVYKLYELWVWNYNMQFEMMLGFSLKDVTVEYSTNGADWTVLKDVQLPQGTARANYVHNATVALDGVAARYVRLNVNSGYGFMGKYGLSEVRFFYIAAQAREPEPADGQIDVAPDAVSLNWRAGRGAMSHEVYFATDEEAVSTGAALADTIAENRYDPGPLKLATTYYWKVNEVNEAETIATWEGDVWSFSTLEYFVVDDFESYTDDVDAGQAIWQTWVDGYEDDANGSQVGYLDAPFAERTTVHSGRQALPLFYENTGGAAHSEAELPLDGAQDWTRAGVTTLVLFTHGDLENAPGQLYVKINDTKVVYDGATTGITAPLWRQWNIDLASAGANLRSVTKLAVGVEGSGSGVLYVDDIRLYLAASAAVTPSDPGAADLVAQYAFEGNLTDSSANGYHGTAADNQFYEDAPGDLGKALLFDGINDYIELPIGSLVGSLTDATLAAWVDFSGTGGAWQRIFDFGNSSSQGYMFLCPREGTNGPIRFAITTAGGGGESVVRSPGRLPAGWHHLAVVIDSAAMMASLYLDGAPVGSGATAALPADLGVTARNWLGRSQYEADGYLGALLADFRIYARALSAGEVRYLVGDR